MRTGLGIAPRIRLASHHALPEITMHPRLVSPIPGRSARSGQGRRQVPPSGSTSRWTNRRPEGVLVPPAPRGREVPGLGHRHERTRTKRL